MCVFPYTFFTSLCCKFQPVCFPWNILQCIHLCLRGDYFGAHWLAISCPCKYEWTAMDTVTLTLLIKEVARLIDTRTLQFPSVGDVLSLWSNPHFADKLKHVVAGTVMWQSCLYQVLSRPGKRRALIYHWCVLCTFPVVKHFKFPFFKQ